MNDEPNLHNFPQILLIRVSNGWIMSNKGGISLIDGNLFVFESTESLAKNLVRIIGKSGWTVERQMPERDDKGHFKPKS